MYQIRIMTFLQMLHGFIIIALASHLTIVLGDFNINKLTTSHDSPSSQLLSKFMTNSISNSICIVPQHKNCSLLIIYGQMSLVMNFSQCIISIHHLNNQEPKIAFKLPNKLSMFNGKQLSFVSIRPLDVL